MTAAHTVIASPIGLLTLVADGGELTAVYMEKHKRAPAVELLGAQVEPGGGSADKGGNSSGHSRKINKLQT